LDRVEVEEELNRILLKIAETQDVILAGLEKDSSSAQMEDLALRVIKDADYWIEQCTKTTEAPSILLRRMQIQLDRLKKIEKQIEETRQR